MFKSGTRLFKLFILSLLCFQLTVGWGLTSDLPKAPLPGNETQQEAQSYYLSKIRFGAYGSTEDRGIFYVDYLLPLFYSQDQNTLLFINPKQSWFTPQSSDEMNIGVGIRHIFNDKFILGLHTFYDKKDSPTHKLYSQVGWGFELLSQPFDFRFNYYDPHTKAKVISESSTGGSGYKFGSMGLIQGGSLTRTYEEPLEGYDFEFGSPIIPKQLKTRMYLGGFFFDSKLAKDYNGMRVRTETDLNKWLSMDMTLNRCGNGETEFIGGLRVTIPLELGKTIKGKNPFKTTPRDTYIKDRIFERVVRDIDVQARSTPAITEDTTVSVPGVEIIYVDDTNAGTEDGTFEHPYTTIDNAIIDSRYVGLGGTAKYIYINLGNSETAPYTGNYTLADDAVFWGSFTDAGYTGLTTTLTRPVIDGARADVLTLGNNNTVMGLKITNGVYGIYADSKTGGTIQDNIISDNGSDGIFIANTNTAISDWSITDNTIENNSGTGIRIYNEGNSGNTSTMTGFTITGNTIDPIIQDGIRISNYTYDNDSAATATGFTIEDNDILGSGGRGISIFNMANGNSNDVSMSTFTISGNTLTDNNSEAIYIYNYSNSYNATAEMSGFILQDNDIGGSLTDEGIHIENRADYVGSNATMSGFTIDGNTLDGTGAYPYLPLGGIYIHNFAQNYGTAEISSVFDITGNTIKNYQQEGISIYNQAHMGYYSPNYAYATVSGFNISGNTVEDNNGRGIYIGNSAGSFYSYPYTYTATAEVTDFTIEDNDILRNNQEGLRLYNDRGKVQNMDILLNTIQDNNQAGIRLENNGGTFTDFTIQENGIGDAPLGSHDGIYLYTDNGADTFTFKENTIRGNRGEGINLNLRGGTVSGFTFDGNTIDACKYVGYYGTTFYDGIYIDNRNSAVSDFDFIGNTITDSKNGIHIRNSTNYYSPVASTISDFTISGNTIRDNNETGIYLNNSQGHYYYAADFTNFYIQDNDILNNNQSGIYLYNDRGRIQNLHIDANINGNNTIENNGQFGIYLENRNGTFTDFTIQDNTIRNNGSSGNYDGIYLYTNNGADTFTFKDNIVTDNTGSGIILNLQGGTVSGFTFDGNTIERNQGPYGGIYIYNYGSAVSDFDFVGNTVSNNTNGDGISISNSYNYWYAPESTMSDFTFSGNTIQNNGRHGIYVYNYGYYIYRYPYSYNSTVSNFSFDGNTITDNTGNGVRFYDTYAYYMYNMDLGGGFLPSAGNNSLYNNGAEDLWTNTNATVFAEDNWWGADVDPSTTGQLSGNIDANPWLPAPPP